jgi:hypothetical protein
MLGHCGFASQVPVITSFCHGMRKGGEFRAPSWSGIDNFNLGEEAVAATSNGFHKAGTLDGVAERLADFADRFVETVVEIHESIRGPELFLEFLTSYDITGALKQQGQDLEGLFLKANSQTVLTQFAGPKIELENPETEARAEVKVFLHGEMSIQGKSECTTLQSLRELKLGTSSRKSFIKQSLPGDPHSREKEPPVH